MKVEPAMRRLDPEIQPITRGDAASMRWLTHVLEGPDDMPAHLKAAVLPVSLQIPVVAGRMMLGRWQGIYLVEHRTAPHHRQVAALFCSAR